MFTVEFHITAPITKIMFNPQNSSSSQILLPNVRHIANNHSIFQQLCNFYIENDFLQIFLNGSSIETVISGKNNLIYQH